MPRRDNRFVALSIFAFVSVASPAAIAGSVGNSEPAETVWRVMFQDAKYNNPCPLTVCSEDMSGTGPMRRAALSPAHVPAAEQHASEAASDIVQVYVLGPDFVGPGDLAAFSEDLWPAGKLLTAMMSAAAEGVAVRVYR